VHLIFGGLKMNKKKLLGIIVVSIILTLSISIMILSAGTDNVKEWQSYTDYNVNDNVSYEGNIYSCIQAHTSLPGWEPKLTPALWGLQGEDAGENTVEPSQTQEPTEETSTVEPTQTIEPTSTDEEENEGNSGEWSDKVFAPYIDVCLYPTFDLNNCYDTTGQKFYTLAFITSDVNGNPAWGGVIPLDDNHMLDQINTLRKNGGDVIVSFGGAAGTELAISNSDIDELVSKYQSVIDKYDLKWVDFDIEGAAVADKTSIEIRNKAIKILQDNNPELKIAFCLPVIPTGLTSDGLFVIENAKENGVRIDLVNVMAMDYGDGVAPNPDGQMGDYAIKSAESTLNQMSESQIDAKIGVTPMIGQNDVQSEVFYLDDAKKVLNWANSNEKVGLLSMWSSTRDNGSGGRNSVANALYSGIEQNEFDFTNIFKDFN
jgi:hypothetical protein